jgi:hypothetical protein
MTFSNLKEPFLRLGHLESLLVELHSFKSKGCSCRPKKLFALALGSTPFLVFQINASPCFLNHKFTYSPQVEYGISTIWPLHTSTWTTSVKQPATQYSLVKVPVWRPSIHLVDRIVKERSNSSEKYDVRLRTYDR